MKQDSWEKFSKAREHFRLTAGRLSKALPDLKNILQEFVNGRTEVSYIVKTPVVYNTALDDVTADSDIKLILVADNPGRREQESKRYLIGPSGKIAQKFFRDNPALGIDFIKNVIILNKTPVHTPRTIQLRELNCMEENKKQSGIPFSQALEESQKKMAEILLEFQKALLCPVWITGYSEMRKNGIFQVFTEELSSLYRGEKILYKKLLIFRHFSMNQFTIDLKKQSLAEESAAKTLERIGKLYRKRILGS
ncbi:MAG: hypothetical protein FWC19_05430 [Treponema sp.]|nr:hypothetical protein [Treponema sp.]MCL2272228.1 hypothetical protein [Treponema sp.]